MSLRRYLYNIQWRSKYIWRFPYILHLTFAGGMLLFLTLLVPGEDREYLLHGEFIADRVTTKPRAKAENILPRPLLAREEQGEHASQKAADQTRGHTGMPDANHHEKRKARSHRRGDNFGNTVATKTAHTPLNVHQNLTHQSDRVPLVSSRAGVHLQSSDKTDPESSPDIFAKWTDRRESQCNEKFVGFANEFVLIQNLLMNKEGMHSNRKGGENIEDVLYQPEKFEFYNYSLGSFQLPCKHEVKYTFNNKKNHLNKWLQFLKTNNLTETPALVVSDFTIAITRYEYVNIYHTMTDWFNAFLLMEYFNKTQKDINILLVDTHPIGALDPVWPVLFNSTMRPSQLPNTTLFTNMAWGMLGYNSPMLTFRNPSLRLVEEFREFFLSSYRIMTARKLDCGKLSVLFIWRRDYLAHPRNPSGHVSRKFGNENELLAAVRRQYKEHRVKGVQIDLFDMQQQLQFISDADILIGMHGAGLTHAMFLQKHAGVIEFVPSNFPTRNEHFAAIARWRNLHYDRWVNKNKSNELPNDQTRIPPHLMVAILRDMIKRVCEPHRPSNASEGIGGRETNTYFTLKFIEPPANERGVHESSKSIRRPRGKLAANTKDISVRERKPKPTLMKKHIQPHILKRKR